METIDEILCPGMDQAEIRFNSIKDQLQRNGVIEITLNNGDKIKNIKSIAKWGTGLFYGFRPNQENFTKSVSINQITP